MDYLRYWSLKEKPFGRDAGRSFFAGVPQREAIARLNYMVVGGMDCGVLLSPSGCGMSTLLRHVARSSGFGDCAVEMLLTRGDQSTIEAVCSDLADVMRLDHRSSDLQSQIDASIDASSRQAVRTVWLVDRCGAEAAMLARWLMDRDRRFSVVMGTVPESASHLAVTLGSCPLRIELPALSLEETANYVRHALYMAGTSSEIFTDTAIVRMHEIGEGRIGVMSSVAELAMAVGAAHNVDQINADMLEVVQEELVRAA